MDLIKELKSDNPNNDRILELLTDENLSHIDEKGRTSLMCAFMYYGKNPNCDSNILLKMLDMNCRLELAIECDNYTILMCAFMFYGSNPNCNSEVFLKLLDMN